MKKILSILLFGLLTIIDAQQGPPISNNGGGRVRPQFQVTYEWNLVDFNWPTADSKMRAIQNAQYIPENNVITGIEVYQNYIFLTLPRLRHGVPATLTWIPSPNITTHTAPLLNPFPSWEMNKLGDCRALQNVQSVEVDVNGILWVIDIGGTATMEQDPDSTCPPRLVLFDLKNQNAIVHQYIFPDSVAKHDGNYLNDLVIDDFNGRFAYITDNSAVDPGLIVYSLTNDTSWKVRDAKSMLADPKATGFYINSTQVNAAINIDGIALSPAVRGPSRDVIFTPLSSLRFYGIDTAILQNQELATSPNVGNFIKDLGAKPSTTDGMIMDEFGILYYGLLGLNAIGNWNTNLPSDTARILARDDTFLQWPDSFAIDSNTGNLYALSNRIQNFLTRNVNPTEANYRILVAYIGARSYLYGPNTYTIPQNVAIINPNIEISTLGALGALNTPPPGYETYDFKTNRLAYNSGDKNTLFTGLNLVIFIFICKNFF